MSNEHPDMSGNWADAPFLCHRCGESFPEDKMFGSLSNDDLSFCSDECVKAWEESHISYATGATE